MVPLGTSLAFRFLRYGSESSGEPLVGSQRRGKGRISCHLVYQSGRYLAGCVSVIGDRCNRGSASVWWRIWMSAGDFVL